SSWRSRSWALGAVRRFQGEVLIVQRQRAERREEMLPQDPVPHELDGRGSRFVLTQGTTRRPTLEPVAYSSKRHGVASVTSTATACRGSQMPAALRTGALRSSMRARG